MSSIKKQLAEQASATAGYWKAAKFGFYGMLGVTALAFILKLSTVFKLLPILALLLAIFCVILFAVDLITLEHNTRQLKAAEERALLLSREDAARREENIHKE